MIEKERKREIERGIKKISSLEIYWLHFVSFNDPVRGFSPFAFPFLSFSLLFLFFKN